ncbi:MAG: ribonuclease HI [Clostridiales bacterium]|nr:ribonuclease HI [Clostridiales bacterium]
MKTLEIHTDGACSGNQCDENVGGWGAILQYGSHEKELFGGELDTTNNRMEMTALLRAFEAVTKVGQSVEVYSDSSYLVNCFREKWYENWLRNGWVTAGKKPVENRDLWEAILPYLARHSIRFFRVKGHVNLNSKKLNLDSLFADFLKNNGGRFTLADFRHIIEMNNRADALANKGIESVTPRHSPPKASENE